MPTADELHDAKLNHFALRSCRDAGDLDYLAARMAFRGRLIPPFLAAARAALAHYFSAIAVLGRIRLSPDGTLADMLATLERRARFELLLGPNARHLLDHLDRCRACPYLTLPDYGDGNELADLDRTVWEIRRYCAVIDYSLGISNRTGRRMLQYELKRIRASEHQPPQSFYLVGGLLESVAADASHPSQKALLWRNRYFGAAGGREKAAIPAHGVATAAPLSRCPEILEEVAACLGWDEAAKESYRRTVEGENDAE